MLRCPSPLPFFSVPPLPSVPLSPLLSFPSVFRHPLRFVWFGSAFGSDFCLEESLPSVWCHHMRRGNEKLDSMYQRRTQQARVPCRRRRRRRRQKRDREGSGVGLSVGVSGGVGEGGGMRGSGHGRRYSALRTFCLRS